uniref:NADH-ubiquinone oxidoreductase chain 3 n=1 Tax=Eurytrema pancreaticum TaxID=374591 RepID=A0A0E3Y718_EUTPN|nr:NADH dehydrogenase subunit 3 [Eurytrema pancreaticum]
MVHGFSVSLLSLFFLGVLAGYYSFLWLIGRSSVSYSRNWFSSFECGFISSSFSNNYFSGTCFGLLVFFVIFDLEVSLLLNMPLQGMGYKNMVFYLVFLFLVSLGFFVEVYNGYVD